MTSNLFSDTYVRSRRDPEREQKHDQLVQKLLDALHRDTHHLVRRNALLAALLEAGLDPAAIASALANCALALSSEVLMQQDVGHIQ